MSCSPHLQMQFVMSWRKYQLSSTHLKNDSLSDTAPHCVCCSAGVAKGLFPKSTRLFVAKNAPQSDMVFLLSERVGGTLRTIPGKSYLN